MFSGNIRRDALKKNVLKIFLICCFIATLFTFSSAQQLTGSLKGLITDNEGNSLPGVTVTASSPSMMGNQAYVTTDTGLFRFAALPPGTYKLVAALPGFKTIARDNIVVRIGMTVSIDFVMEVAAVEEQVTVTATSPTVDVESSKISVTMDNEVLKNIPMARDLYDVVNSIPGAVSEGAAYRRTSVIHGATVRGNTYAFDGVNMNDPVVMYPLTNINFDVIQEVEMVTGGHPAEVGYTDGGYINVVTKSGGNSFSGAANFYYSSEDTTKVLFPDTQLKAMGVKAPEYAVSDLDVSGSLGGPIIRDRLWFFGNARYLFNSFTSPFRPATIAGEVFEPAPDMDHTEMMGFAKLTAQFSSKLKFMGMFNYTDIYEPYFKLDKGWNVAPEAMRRWDHEKGYTGNAIITWLLDPNTFLDLRAGYVRRYFPVPLQPDAVNNPVYADGSTTYAWGSARFNETYLRKRFQASAYITRFQDNFLGGSHEFKAGVEFEDAYGDWNWWRANSMIWNYWNNNPYWSRARGLSRTTYGDGNLAFYICATEKDKSLIADKAQRIGGFLQDSMTIKNRLTINAGLRVDYSYGFKPGATKGRSDQLAYDIGNYYLVPAYGVNPYGELETPEWKDIITWTTLSPRLGITYDVFGNGKTALKASLGRYTEYLMLQYFSVLHPFYPRTFAFYWFDENNNSIPDSPPVDKYVHFGTTPDVMKFEYSAKKIDPNTKSPISDEMIIQLQHEVMKDFSLSIAYIYKNKTNIVEDVLYDPASDKYWYTYDLASDWWIPFTTVIPAHDNYLAQEVTMYFLSKSAPALWLTMANVPEAKRKYQAFELSFNKRMSNGWQLGGSVVLSKMEGNIGGGYGVSWGWSGAFNNANYLVNNYGRLDFDRPVVIKLFGTFELPYKIFASFFFNHYDGAPFQRTVTIYPPAAWAAANNVDTRYSYAINVETAGVRRTQGTDILDLRLEKTFNLGTYGRLGIFLDAFNILGFNQVLVNQNPAGTWRPTQPGEDDAKYFAPSASYKVVTGVQGTRQFKFSLRYTF